VAKQQHVSRAPTQPIDDAVGALRDIGCGFALRAAILEQSPTWALCTYLRRSASFVLTVVLLDQIRVDGRDRVSGKCADR